jgi:hypothetical protein
MSDECTTVIWQQAWVTSPLDLLEELTIDDVDAAAAASRRLADSPAGLG